MMIGNGTPSSQSKAPRPKPMTSSSRFYEVTTREESQRSNQATVAHTFSPAAKGTIAGGGDLEVDRVDACARTDTTGVRPRNIEFLGSQDFPAAKVMKPDQLAHELLPVHRLRVSYPRSRPGPFHLKEAGKCRQG
jgi:hypothetical protein